MAPVVEMILSGSDADSGSFDFCLFFVFVSSMKWSIDRLKICEHIMLSLPAPAFFDHGVTDFSILAGFALRNFPPNLLFYLCFLIAALHIMRNACSLHCYEL